MIHLKLGDRVKVNETCEYPDYVGEELFVCGISIDHNLHPTIWLTDTWPPNKHNICDGWKLSELDLITPPVSNTNSTTGLCDYPICSKRGAGHPLACRCSSHPGPVAQPGPDSQPESDTQRFYGDGNYPTH